MENLKRISGIHEKTFFHDFSVCIYSPYSECSGKAMWLKWLGGKGGILPEFFLEENGQQIEFL